MTVDVGSITVTGKAQHQAWQDRVLPPVEEVRPGLWSIPTPFVDSPLRYVLAYLIETPAGLALIDTGWPNDAAWDGLVAGVQSAGHDIADVAAVLVTHNHADHFGLAMRVREASGARVALHRLDAAATRNFTGIADFIAMEAAWQKQRGIENPEEGGMLPNPPPESPLARRPEIDVLLEDGDHPMGAGTDLRVVWTPGHTPGHICFVHEGHDVILTGDHLLPRISPNISPAPSFTEDSLGDYLGSLEALTQLEVGEVLPAHEYRFAGMTTRVRQLQLHHERRLAEILAVVEQNPGCTTLRIAEELTWSRPWSENLGMIRRSAVGETYAHLLHLARRGQLTNGSPLVDAWHAARSAV